MMIIAIISGLSMIDMSFTCANTHQYLIMHAIVVCAKLYMTS